MTKSQPETGQRVSTLLMARHGRLYQCPMHYCSWGSASSAVLSRVGSRDVVRSNLG